MELNILRRIAERGLQAAQDEENSQMIDCWQHLLDELERQNSTMQNKKTELEDRDQSLRDYLAKHTT